MDVPVAIYAPDQPPLGAFTRDLLNVVSKSATAYSPVNALAAVTEALGARCQGAFSGRATDGTVRTFAGDATKLYYEDPTDGTQWNDATRTSGGAYAAPSDGFWWGVKYGDLAIFVNGADAAQKFDITSDTNFSALGGSPPVAKFIAVWGNYVVLGNFPSGRNDSIQWSGTDDPESWTVGVDNSDERTFPDAGEVTGLTSGRQKLVFLDGAIWRATEIGGTEIFQLNQISDGRGCVASGSIAQSLEKVFFLAADGFFQFSDEGFRPIGAQLVNDTFWADVNRTYLRRITAACDTVRGLYHICYPSNDSATGLCDRKLTYNWVTERWTPQRYDIEILRRVLSGTGTTLEALDTLYPGGLDTIPISLDSPAFRSTPEEALAAFDSSHQMCLFDGATLAARIASPKAQVIPGYKAKIRSVRAICDGGDPDEHLASLVVHDDKLNDAARTTAQVQQRDTGRFPFAARRTKGRYHGVVHDIAAGAEWSNFQGWDFDAVQAGRR